MNIRARRYDTRQSVLLAIESGRIVGIDPLDSAPGDLPWVAPGFVDIQVNGYGGQEFSSPDLSTDRVHEIVRRLGEFGVTRFCPTTTTECDAVLSHAVRTIAAACEESAETAHRAPGIHVEGPYISPIDGPRGAHPRRHCRPPDYEEFCRWQEAAGGRIRLITLSPEYDGTADFIARVVQSDVVVAIGHTAADGAQVRAAVDAGATLSTHLGNGAHRELRRHPNYIWDQLANDRLTASLIVDGHHLPPEVVQTFVRAKTPNRCILISDLSGLAGLPPGRYASHLDEVEIMADGRLVVAGQTQLLAGASRPIGAGITNVMRFAGVDLATAIDMATLQPAQLLGLDAQGLVVGAPADMALFDLIEASASEEGQQLVVRSTIVAGETVYTRS